ncbi:hypothetical protein OPV22_008260 [Ensete ventricosum]|uniref:Uncharacterized protein n=1 Tax=Ensete ventricosum TaxID=4639 RepID=A0AAV8R2H7_ENSVE|nr:hypothetical protein OPV22_008260 [Ensete ventricosum]
MTVTGTTPFVQPLIAQYQTATSTNTISPRMTANSSCASSDPALGPLLRSAKRRNSGGVIFLGSVGLQALAAPPMTAEEWKTVLSREAKRLRASDDCLVAEKRWDVARKLVYFLAAVLDP